ncbi:MAG: protein kinase domain-containing protein [Kofleriaceae bacterium]
MSLGATTRPSRLGRYELITQIGQGGMAEVQLAIQRGPAGFEKLVVVKLIHENLATQKAFVDMLLEEARMAALVKHPNVVDIYDLGQAEGRYFIAMEYLEGEPLLAVLRAGRDGKRLDALSTGRLIADTAEGLDAAHELRTMAGDPIELVHHDVSLGNIVVLYNGQVKLVDFGVAKATQSAGPTIRIQGKFSYMAPEKLRGGSGDRRSDIWSLGCVLWEALTLRRLFKGGNDAETMKQVLETQLVPPSSVNPDVPKDFDPIVMCALSRNPAGRYATAKEMAGELEEVLREHKYGGRNDVIAKYMQSTFDSHIIARKKLLQEVSSKGRASADVLEAAFDEMSIASGSPQNMDTSGAFSVKFARAAGDSLPPATTPVEDPLLAQRPRTASPSLLEKTAPPIARPLTNGAYEPERAVTGGGTVAKRSNNTKIIAIVLVGLALAAAAVVFAMRGDDDAPIAKPTPDGSGSVIAPASIADAAFAEGTGDAVVEPSATDAAITTPTVDAAADPVIEPDKKPTTGSGIKPRPTPPTPKPNAQELFKTGMQAFVKGDAKTAVTLFRKATTANPSYGAAWRALGLAHEKLGEWGPAKTAFLRYLAVSPNASDATQIRERIKNL